MTVNDLIKELQKWKRDGWGNAKVLVRCEGFSLIDMDSDYEETSFDAVPTTGVEEGTNTNGISHVILGREEPDDVKRRMCESGWWAEPAQETEEPAGEVEVE